MKKLLMSLALLGTFAAMSAKGATTDSYMYWMVDVTGDSSVGSFNSAELYAYYSPDNRIYLGGSTPMASDSRKTETVPAIYEATGIPYNIGSLETAGLSFMVELYNDSTFVSQSSLMSYADALASGGIYQHLSPSGGATPVTFTSFAVPEPTSGLLMLFGLCGLALKRKRA